MISDRLLDELNHLSRADKLRAMQFLLNALSAEESGPADEKAMLVADLRQSIREAMTGQTIPASKLMQALDDDE